MSFPSSYDFLDSNSAFLQNFDLQGPLELAIGNDLEPDLLDRFQVAAWTPFSDFLDTSVQTLNYFSTKKVFLVQGGSIFFDELLEEEHHYFIYSGKFSEIVEEDTQEPLAWKDVIIKVNKVIQQDPVLSQRIIKNLKREARLLKKLNSLSDDDRDYAAKFLSKAPIGKHHYCLIHSDYSTRLSEFIGPNHLPEFITRLRGFEEVYRIALQLLLALQEFQKPHIDIFHGDIRPKNISIDEDTLNICFLNFNSFSTIQNTLIDYSFSQEQCYHSPETFFGLPKDKSNDLWAVGCLLFELFSGVKLFNASSKQEIMTQFLIFLGPIPESIQKNIEEFLALEKEAIKELQFKQFLSLEPSEDEIDLFSYHFFNYFDSSLYEDVSASDFTLEETSYNCDETRSLFLQFLRSIFKWEKSKRASIEELLDSPFMKKMKVLIS
jgi:serine/threonine protein kinase